MALKDYILSYRETRPLSQEEKMEEFMFLGLRKTAGVKGEDFVRQFGRTMDSVYGEVIDTSVKGGWIERDRDSIALTKKGILFSNHVLSEFLLSE